MKHLNDQYFSGNQLKEVADPSVATDAATKGYVDDAIETLQLRTLNGELLTKSNLGDINLFDGFYFPNATQDYDGNWYGAVIIGNQVWLGENLRTTHMPDGTAITKGPDKFDGGVIDETAYADVSDTEPFYYRVNPYFGFDDKKSGFLYNLPAATNGEQPLTSADRIQGIAPTGWHLPTKSDFMMLLQYIKRQKRYNPNPGNGYGFSKCLASKTKWRPNSTMDSNSDTENNITGFNAFPVGFEIAGFVMYSGEQAMFWTSSRTSVTATQLDNFNFADHGAYTFEIDKQNTEPSLDGYNPNITTKCAKPADWGLSVRCISDLTPAQFLIWYIEQYGSSQHHIVDYSDIENTPDDEIVYVNATKTGNFYYLPKSPQELRDLFTAKKTVIVTVASGIILHRSTNSNPTFFAIVGNDTYRLYFYSNAENGVDTPWILEKQTKGFPSYTNNAGKVLAVNSNETDVEWVTISGGGGTGQLAITDDDNGNIGLSLTGGSQSLSVTDDDNGNITLTLN